MICHLHYEARPCRQCETTKSAAVDFTLPRVNVITFKEHVPEHIFDPWEKARSFDSPESLRVECEKRGVTSHYLRDSLLWKSGARKWF